MSGPIPASQKHRNTQRANRRMGTTQLAGRRTIPLQISACRQSSTGLPTIVSRLADSCEQACRQLSAGNFQQKNLGKNASKGK